MWLMLFTHYLFGYVGTVLCSIGLLLSLCSIYIFTRHQMRSTVSTYLASLSVSDSCLLFMGLLTAINYSIHPDQQSEYFYSSRFYKLIFPYIYPCIIWFQFTSVWITIGFAVDRWFAIKWPMLHYTYSSKRASYIVVAIYCFGFIYSLPRYFEYKTISEYEELTMPTNETEYYEHLVVTNNLLNNRMYHYIVQLVLYSIFQSILPLLMLSYFNVELIRSINASSNFLKHFTSLSQQNSTGNGHAISPRHRECSVTRSVICLIVLFTLCQVPASILHYLYMFYRNDPILYISYDVSNFLIFVNSTVDFFIFTYFNRRFRTELTSVCFHFQSRRDSLLQTPSMPSFPRTNSTIKHLQRASQPVNMMQANASDGPSQSHNTRVQLRTNDEQTRNKFNLLRRKSSLLSVKSPNHILKFSCRSESLITTNKNSRRIEQTENLPMKDKTLKKSNNVLYVNDQYNSPITSMDNHERTVSIHKKHSFLTCTNTSSYHIQKLHYITKKSDSLNSRQNHNNIRLNYIPNNDIELVIVNKQEK